MFCKKRDESLNLDVNSLGRRSSHRVQRIAHQIQREIASLLLRELRDVTTLLTTLYDVELSSDYSHAKVFVSFLGGNLPGHIQEALKTLRASTRRIRGLLAQRLKLRLVPMLHFHYAPHVAHGAHIQALLAQSIASGA